MSEKNYDIAVVGGGPAGSSAAWQAARTGASVVLVDKAEFPHFSAWFDRMMARPAVARGLAVAAERRSDLSTDEEAKKILFGQRAR